MKSEPHRAEMSRCVLCKRTEETKTTGPLLRKRDVTAHQNCLLYSSGIFCRDSPELDDLFGFSVEDVNLEEARGKRLSCSFCKKSGATAGCGVKRCKRSYHYPCAIEEGAKPIPDKNGKYEIYCLPHYQKNFSSKENGKSGSSSPSTDEAGQPKAHCLVCEKKEGSVSLDSLSTAKMEYCKKHAPLSQQRTNGDSAVAGPSGLNNGSSSSRRSTHSSAKRRLSWSFKSVQQESLSKRKPERWNKIMSDDSSNSDDDKPSTDMQIFAPIESDLEESPSSAPQQQQQQLQRDVAESATAPPSGDHQVDENRAEDKDADETMISSDTESQSLLSPLIRSSDQCCQTDQTQFLPIKPELQSSVEKNEGSSPPQHPAEPQDRSPSPPRTNHQPEPCGVEVPRPDSIPPPSPPPEPVNLSAPASPPSTAAPPQNLEPNIDARGFWRSCNAAGCTQAIVNDFMSEMNEIAGRIQSDEASQEDYDILLSVMKASGKLSSSVAKQEEELQKKQIELQAAMTAMTEVVSALTTRP